MPAYDSERFDPPAPVAWVTLRNPANNAVLPDVPMLLDTGSDITLIPQAAASQLEAEVIMDRRYQLIAFDGTTSLASAARLDMVFSRRTFRGHFLLTDQAWGILGRNILNMVPLLLDGPHLEWEEHSA